MLSNCNYQRELLLRDEGELNVGRLLALIFTHSLSRHCVILPETPLSPKKTVFQSWAQTVANLSNNEVFFVVCTNEDEKNAFLVNTFSEEKGNQSSG